jgi:hypothetical protein
LAVNVARFQQHPVYRSHAPASALLEDLDQVARLDRHTELKNLALALPMMAAFVIGGLLFLVAFVALVMSHRTSEGALNGDAATVMWVTGLGSLGLFAVGAALLFGLHKLAPYDLEDRRYELALVLLKRLQVDLDPAADVHLMLDLRALDVPEKRVREDQAGGWTTRLHVDPWFTLEARMADGASVRIHMTEWLRVRERFKTSASGRRKVKRTRRKGRTRLDVSVRVKPERYPGLARMQGRLEAAARLPERASLERARAEADRLSLRARLTEDWVAKVTADPDDPGTPQTRKQKALERDEASRAATMMLLSLYQVLGHARRVGKRQRARRARSV